VGFCGNVSKNLVIIRTGHTSDNLSRISQGCLLSHSRASTYFHRKTIQGLTVSPVMSISDSSRSIGGWGMIRGLDRGNEDPDIVYSTGSREAAFERQRT
jgi:hypothetical protein